MPSVISCVCWVKKGVSKEIPDQVKLTQDEIKTFLKNSEDQLKQLDLASPDDDVDMSTKDEDVKDATIDDQDDIDRLYGLDHYDSDDDDNDNDDDDDDKGVKVSGAGMGNSLVGLTYYSNNEDDPYITLKEEDNDSDTDDFNILPSDNLLLVGQADEEYSCIEVKVYNEATHHSYNHHEIMLNAYPLCLEWMDFNAREPDRKGSFVAVGTMLPMIEVWDLDLVDAIEPLFTLGNSKLSKKKKKTKKATDQVDSHTDAVMCLSWNKLVRSILASGSADCSVAVWDLSQGKCVVVIPHPDKVQSLSWHHYEPQLLATGCFDKVVRIFDCSGNVKSCINWNVSGEIEKVLWNHFIPNNLLVSTEDGMIHSIDRTQPGSKLFTLNAHDSSLTDFSLSCYLPGLLATVSHDKTVKCWDIKENKPVFLFAKDLHMGALYCCNFCVDVAHTLVVGGATGEVRLMNLQQVQPIKNHFIGENLLQTQIRGSTLLESSDFEQKALKDTTKSHVKEQLSSTVKTKHISHKKRKHKKRY